MFKLKENLHFIRNEEAIIWDAGIISNEPNEIVCEYNLFEYSQWIAYKLIRLFLKKNKNEK